MGFVGNNIIQFGADKESFVKFLFYNLFTEINKQLFLVFLVFEETLVPVMLWNLCMGISCVPALVSEGF